MVAAFPGNKKERETGFEPATFALARRRSTPEPLALIDICAGDCFLRTKRILLYSEAFVNHFFWFIGSYNSQASQLCFEFVGTLKTRCLPALCIGCIAAIPSSYRSVVASPLRSGRCWTNVHWTFSTAAAATRKA